VPRSRQSAGPLVRRCSALAFAGLERAFSQQHQPPPQLCLSLSLPPRSRKLPLHDTRPLPAASIIIHQPSTCPHRCRPVHSTAHTNCCCGAVVRPPHARKLHRPPPCCRIFADGRRSLVRSPSQKSTPHPQHSQITHNIPSRPTSATPLGLLSTTLPVIPRLILLMLHA